MATKATGVPCYDKALPEEPIFVLRAQDKLAHIAVDAWADEAEEAGVNAEKVVQARATAQLMRDWKHNGNHVVKLPD